MIRYAYAFSNIAPSTLKHEAQYFGLAPLVRRLTLCEELDVSSCGTVLFHAMIPAPNLPFERVTVERKVRSRTLVMFSLKYSFLSLYTALYFDFLSIVRCFPQFHGPFHNCWAFWLLLVRQRAQGLFGLNTKSCHAVSSVKKRAICVLLYFYQVITPEIVSSYYTGSPKKMGALFERQ